MSDTETDGMNLASWEAEALAHRIIARRVSDSANWLMWEDYPNLGEHAFRRLCGFVDSISADLIRMCDLALDVDSQDLLERATS